MRHYLRSLPIKTKLTLIILGTCLAALLFEGIGFALYENNRIRKDMQADAQTLTRLIANRSTAALAFNDSQVAYETLSALKENPDVIAACVYGLDGDPFAHYPRDSKLLQTCPRHAHFTEHVSQQAFGFRVVELAALDGQPAGWVTLDWSSRKENEVWSRLLQVTVVLVLLTLIVVGLIAQRMRRLISSPIERLTQTLDRITSQQNFRLRAGRENADEIGSLVTAVNSMLNTIEDRTTKLQQTILLLEASEDRVREITKRKQVETELVRFKQFARYSGQGMGMATLDGEVTYLNPVLCGWLLNDVNASPEQYSNMYVPGLYPQPYRELYKKTIIPHVLEHGIWTGELALTRADGSVFPTLETLFLIRDEDGAPMNLCDIIVDITHQKAEHAQLKEAQEAADSANRAKSDFLANMSHEIRTPMNAIIGMSHLALQTDLTPRQRNYIEKSHQAAENLLGILNDVLDFSKIEAGKLGMENIPFRLDDVLDNLSSVHAARAESKGLEFLFDLQPGLPDSLTGDPLRLGQVLSNLIGNAIKFTEHGEVVVHVSTLESSANQIELQFSIRDSGIGLTESQRDKLFAAFTQADASITRRYGGTGLGLSISQNLVSLMQGHIWVESEPGLGSTFHFTARFGVLDGVAQKSVVPSESLQDVRVLIVDDNLSALRITSAMAHYFGMDITQAHNSEEAIQALLYAEKTGQPFQILLIDWKMPGLDGIECIDQMRKLQLSKVPAAIMVTAFSREDATAEALERGIDIPVILTKPVTASSLLETLGKALGRDVLVSSQSQRTQSSQEAQKQLAGARMLLVEDNDLNQELVTELLQNVGVTVVVANDGKQALDILARDTDFACILMDCQMPVMDGYTATRQLRRNPALIDTPVIAITANAMQIDRERSIESGMNDHVAKPIQVDQLYLTLAAWVKPSTGMRPITEVADTGEHLTLPSIAELDTQKGLASASGNRALYRKLIRRFVEGNAHFANQFHDAVAAGDLSTATRLAHTLKGTAGTIGATGVQALARKLEEVCLKDDIEGFAAPIGEIEQALLGLLPQLHQWLQATETALTPINAPVELDARTLLARLRNMQPLLEDGDTSACTLPDGVRPYLQGSAYQDLFSAFEAALNQYDFDGALTALRQLIQQLEAKA